MNIDVGLWRKPMGCFTPADWGTLSPVLDTMLKCVCTVTNNNVSMRMLCNEVRTGVTQFAAGGVGKIPPYKGKQAVQVLMNLIEKANAPFDVRNATVEELFSKCLDYMQRGVAYEKELAETTLQAAKDQKNPAYVFRGMSRSRELITETTDAATNAERMIAEFRNQFFTELKKEMEPIRDALPRIENGVGFLVTDRMDRKAQNKVRGKQNQSKASHEFMEAQTRAAADMKTALGRVANDPNVKAGKHGAVLAACRRVCRKFKPLTHRKNALGEFECCAPLTDWQGKEIKPETLAKNFRTKYGKAKERKAQKKKPGTK